MAQPHLRPASFGSHLFYILFSDGTMPGWQAYQSGLSGINRMNDQIISSNIGRATTEHISRVNSRCQLFELSKGGIFR